MNTKDLKTDLTLSMTESDDDSMSYPIHVRDYPIFKEAIKSLNWVAVETKIDNNWIWFRVSK